MSNVTCRICGAATTEVGRKFGQYAQQWYDIRHCPECHYSFVANPWTEYDKIYSADYYAGRGADPYVDYAFELAHPEQTIRYYEWSGILRLVSSLTHLTPQTQWLDFGCGNGGLVRYVRQHTNQPIIGFDEGWISNRAIEMGIPFLTKEQLDASAGVFDVITAIEVLEHIVDPLDTLRSIRRLLKPGGLFFFTTGNARPFRDRLLSWRYLIPEIHVSFFEPDTLTRALTIAGLCPELRPFPAGFDDIIRFKVLKNLGGRRRFSIERMLPWSAMARIVDARLAITAHPIAWAPGERPTL